MFELGRGTPTGQLGLARTARLLLINYICSMGLVFQFCLYAFGSGVDRRARKGRKRHGRPKWSPGHLRWPVAGGDPLACCRLRDSR